MKKAYILSVLGNLTWNDSLETDLKHKTMQGLHMFYSLASDVKSFCIHVLLLGSFSLVFYPQPSQPLLAWKVFGKYLSFHCYSVWRCLVVAAKRVVIDTLPIRLSVIWGSTFLSVSIPQAHLLLMGLKRGRRITAMCYLSFYLNDGI